MRASVTDSIHALFFFVARYLLHCASDTRRSSYQHIAKDANAEWDSALRSQLVAVNLSGCAILYVILASTLIQTMVSERTDVHELVHLYVIACSFFVWVCLIFTKSMKEVAFLR